MMASCTVIALAFILGISVPIQSQTTPVEVNLTFEENRTEVFESETDNTSICIITASQEVVDKVVNLTVIFSKTDDDTSQATKNLKLDPFQSKTCFLLSEVDIFKDDDVYEQEQNFILSLSTTFEKYFSFGRPANIILKDDDTITVGWDEENYDFKEDEENTPLCIIVTSGSFIDIPLFGLELTEGTAKNGTDFLINSTSFKPTDDVFCINIFMIDDEEFESLIPENFTLKLVIDDIHVTIEPDTTYISITDNEVLEITITGATVNESEPFQVCANKNTTTVDEFVITISSSNGTAESGKDFAQERIPSTIILQPEETMKCFVSDAINDDEIALEPTEFFTLTINDVTPNDDTRINLGPPTIIIINDNDDVTITLENDTYEVDEGVSEVEICAILVNDIATSVSFNVVIPPAHGNAEEGLDFNVMPQPSSLNFVPNGHRRLCTKVIIIDDGMIESENLFVEISGDNNIVLQARIFITDNEVITVGFEVPSITVEENSNNLSVCLVKNRTTFPISVHIISVDGTAINGTDYQYLEMPMPITIEPSETSVCFTNIIIINHEITIENDTFFFLYINETEPKITLGIDQVRVIITDDDNVASLNPNTMVGCTEDRSCEESPVTSTIKDCCDHDIYPSGLAYTIPGEEDCFLCPVDFGFTQSSFSGSERVKSYMVQVKFFSGGITDGFLFLPSLELSGTASNSDVTLETTRSRFLANDFLQPKDVEFSLNVDNIAQESNESFVLSFNSSSIDQFGVDVNIRDRLEVVIIDSDVIAFQLSEGDYTQNEEPNAVMEVLITKEGGIQLANPVYFRLTPLTVGDALTRGVISQFDPENPFSPNRANYKDFNDSVLYFEFPTDRDAVEVAIPIVDDDIDEADEQVFIIFLEIMNATNLNILENRNISVSRIRDNEITRIGFERQSYEVTEPNPDDDNVISNLVYLVREDNRKSEQTYSVDLTVSDPGGITKPATIASPNTNQSFDYSLIGVIGQTEVNVLFPPTVDRIAFVFSLNPDLAVEGTETFRATSAQVTPSGDFPVFQTPGGVTAFANTLIHILDNNELRVGFEELSYTVSESAGTVEVCVVVISPPSTVDLDVSITLSPSTINGTAEAGSDFTQLTAFLSILTFPSSPGSPTAGPRRECFDVTITDDDSIENTESFSLLLQEDIFAPQTGAIIHPDRTDIIILDDDVSGCPIETDQWDIIWPNTPPDNTTIQRCPGGSESIGNAVRYCDGNKVWSSTDALSCASVELVNLLEEAREAFLSNDSGVLLNASTFVTSQLANITTGRELPLFPMDLQITNSLIHSVINILEDNADVLQQYSATKPDVDDVISVFNNVLDESNTAGWLNLLNVETMNGSELLLSNAERYGLMIAKEVEVPRRLSRPNIVLSASQFNVSSRITDKDLSFSIGEDLAIHTIPIMAKIPADLIREKLTTSSSVPVVHILFNNLEDFLPPSFLDSSESPNKTSMIYSIQIGERKDQSQVLLDKPISLEFTLSTSENDSYDTCAFWDFSKPIGSGGFSTDGVTTASINRGENVTTVQCLSTHATSFAVLVDVAGGLETVSEGELKALQVVSYFGCSVSILCLSLTVLFFLAQRKKTFQSVNFFIHLNLASTLLAAFVVFVFGIELGKITTGGCLFVALLLHYLFLSAFCWMLCEGILLYLLLVVVFSRLTRRWWLFILIGYVSPIPIVVISVASRHDYYGVRSSDGVLKYCWLSVEKGTIYAFVAPMLVIILINVVFLVLSLNSLVKSKIKRYSRKKADKKANFTMAKSLFIASIILLPLLGLTWTFGILTINSDSTVFAWLFTILNSLQGAAIFFFHVVRNETIWSKIRPRLSILSSKILGTKGDTKLHTSENSSWSTKSRYTRSSICSKGYDMNAFPKRETSLKAKPTDSTMFQKFNNPLVLEETKINLEKLPDNDKVKNEGIKVEEREEQAKENAEKETNIINHHDDVNSASEYTITIEIAANGSQEDVEGDNKVVSKSRSDEAEVDNMSMEESSTINPAVSDYKDVNLNREDNKAEGTKRKQLESKVESMDDNAEVESNGSGALY